MSLAISRGATMADIIALLEGDRADAKKLNPHYLARCQSRSDYAWTWRRCDGKPAVCAGLSKIRPLPERLRYEAWFTCRPDLTTAELHDFMRFAALTLRWVALECGQPIEAIAFVARTAGRSAGERIARMIGFRRERELGGQWVYSWQPQERAATWLRH